MALLDLFKKRNKPANVRSVQFLNGDDFTEVIGRGFSTLADNPEVITACFKISQLISSMTIYLMSNTKQGDVRVTNELSRKIDISPNKNMTRSTFMTAIIMNMLLYGNGNAVVYPHTKNGRLEDLEPIEAKRVSFSEVIGRDEYRINIDGKSYDPKNVLHFVFNPDEQHLWKGKGFRIPLKPIVDNLAQAQATTNAFMASKWKPSIIIKVDALTEEFASPEGRQKLLDSYIKTNRAGEPWLIPADQFSVEQVRPLSLADLAINDSVTIDKRTVAAILGVPAFLLGVGEYNNHEWNSFISNTVRPIAQSVEQELTRKLIISPKMYLMFNVNKLYSYDLTSTANIYSSLYNRGIVTGNEVREKMGLQPLDGLDDLIVLENYIPIEKIGDQEKLN